MYCILRVTEGPAEGETRFLASNQKLSIGRDRSDLCVVDDPHLSRNHLIVEGANTHFRVRDVGSSNGTFVNDSRVAIAHLCNGDRIAAGSSVIAVELEEGEVSDRAQDWAKDADRLLDNLPSRTWTAEEGLGESSSAQKPGVEFLEETLRTDESQMFDFPLVVREAFEVQAPCIGLLPGDEESRAKSLEVLDLLSKTNWPGSFHLIVNVDKLTASAKADFIRAQRSGCVSQIAETLHLFSMTDREEFFGFYKSTLGADAAICIASPAPIHEDWLLENINLFSYPSLLWGVIELAPIRASKVLQGITALVFEQPSSAGLCLLHQDLLAR